MLQLQIIAIEFIIECLMQNNISYNSSGFRTDFPLAFPSAVQSRMSFRLCACFAPQEIMSDPAGTQWIVGRGWNYTALYILIRRNKSIPFYRRSNNRISWCVCSRQLIGDIRTDVDVCVIRWKNRISYTKFETTALMNIWRVLQISPLINFIDFFFAILEGFLTWKTWLQV